MDDVESIWTTLFAKVSWPLPTNRRCDFNSNATNQALDGKNVKEMLLNVGSGGGAAAAPAAAGGAAGGAADAPAEEKKEEKKEEEKEESDEDMGFGLFD